MSVLTGATGELRYDGTKIGKCRDFNLSIRRNTVETTVLGVDDRTYDEGLRSSSATATILYDSADTGAKSFLNSILTNGGAKETQLFLDEPNNKKLSGDVLVTDVGVPVTVGDITACSISFQFSGALTGTFT